MNPVPHVSIAPLIKPFRVSLTPPGSKSLSNRALLLAAMAHGPCQLTGVLFSDDTAVMIAALRQLGFELSVDEPAKSIRVVGQGGRVPGGGAGFDLMLGNAGTAYRFLTAYCCVGEGVYRLDGVPRMRQRPVAQLVEALRELGADVRYLGQEGCPPLEIRSGTLVGVTALAAATRPVLRMAPTLSSQYISALLHIAPCLPAGLTLEFDGPVTSEPYVRMTLALMARFEVKAQADQPLTRIDIAPGSYRCERYAVEPDASNASYFLAAAAITPGASCTIEGLGKASLQGDVGFADVLHQMGADLIFGRDFITITGPKAGALRGIDINLNAMPDMAQTLAVAALFAQGETVIRDVGNLRVKETDRLEALRIELSKLGAQASIEGDDLRIVPPVDGKLRPAAIDTYDDHRMAMSFAIAGLRAPGVVINEPACVNKTFPDYFEFLERLRT